MVEGDLVGSKLETRIVLDHVARHRWWYLALPCVLLLYAMIALSELRRGVLLPAALGLLVYVLPLWRRLSWLQWIARYACVLLLTLITATGMLLSLLDTFDRYTDQGRMHEVASWLKKNNLPGDHVWSVLISSALLGAVVLTLLRTRRPTRVRMVRVLLGTSIACLTFAVPSTVVHALHGSGEFLDFGVAFFACAAALGTLCWGVIALVVLARRQDVDAAVEPASETSPADKYVASGSSVALTALAIALFGLTTCWEYADGLERLIGVRTAVASDLIAAAVATTPAMTQELAEEVARDAEREKNRKGDSYNETLNMFWSNSYYSHGTTHLKVLQSAWQGGRDVQVKPAWMEEAALSAVRYQSNDFLGTTAEGIVFGVRVKEYGLPGSWQAAPVLSFPADLRTNHTVVAAAECADSGDAGAAAGAGTSYEKAYRTCEKAALQRGVKFPVVDVVMPVQYVIVASFIGIAGCLMVFTDRVSALLKMPPSTKIEPWILLDASQRGSRLLANGWVLALAVSPWLLIATAVRITALQVRAEGSVSGIGHDWALSGVLLAGVGMSLALSTSMLGGLIALRRMRHYQMQAQGVDPALDPANEIC